MILNIADTLSGAPAKKEWHVSLIGASENDKNNTLNESEKAVLPQ
jgi:hypothetical protein